MTDSVLFVFYTINPESSQREWIYPRLPQGWNWTGAGMVNPVRGPTRSNLYQQEEQFKGPLENRERTRRILDRIFQNLKNNNVILRYKIRNSYLP